MFNNIILKINILSFMTGFLPEILSVHTQSPDGDSPGGACGSAASVSISETSLTFRCGPVGPSYLNPQSLRDSPLLRGATPHFFSTAPSWCLSSLWLGSRTIFHSVSWSVTPGHPPPLQGQRTSPSVSSLYVSPGMRARLSAQR